VLAEPVQEFEVQCLEHAGLGALVAAAQAVAGAPQPSS
jgi:hypothetical protein